MTPTMMMMVVRGMMTAGTTTEAVDVSSSPSSVTVSVTTLQTQQYNDSCEFVGKLYSA